jgi:hypothetical protein
MNTKQNLMVVSLLTSVLTSGCAMVARTAEQAATPVKVEAVQSYSASGGARYSASIVPGSQVELSFSVGGYLDRISSESRIRRGSSAECDRQIEGRTRSVLSVRG